MKLNEMKFNHVQAAAIYSTWRVRWVFTGCVLVGAINRKIGEKHTKKCFSRVYKLLTVDAAESCGASVTFTRPIATDPSLVSTRGTLRGEESLGVGHRDTRDSKKKRRRIKARHLLLQRRGTWRTRRWWRRQRLRGSAHHRHLPQRNLGQRQDEVRLFWV